MSENFSLDSSGIFSIIKHKISAIFLFVAVILRIFAARNSIIRMIKDEEL